MANMNPEDSDSIPSGGPASAPRPDEADAGRPPEERSDEEQDAIQASGSSPHDHALRAPRETLSSVGDQDSKAVWLPASPYFVLDVVQTVTLGHASDRVGREDCQATWFQADTLSVGDAFQHEYTVIDDLEPRDQQTVNRQHPAPGAEHRAAAPNSSPQGAQPSGNAAGDAAGDKEKQAEFVFRRRDPAQRRSRADLLAGLEALMPLVSLGVVSPAELNATRATVDALIRHQAGGMERAASSRVRPDLHAVLELIRQQPLLLHSIQPFLSDDELDFLARNLAS